VKVMCYVTMQIDLFPAYIIESEYSIQFIGCPTQLLEIIYIVHTANTMDAT
jgi:hypothetical protein